jgi:Glycosyl transferase family 2
MSRTLAPERLAVIVAAIDARATFDASLARWREEADEVVLVDASRDGTADAAEAAFPDIRVLRRSAGRLAPELWRDGFDATGAALVALTTAAMVPAPGWRAAMLDRLGATGAAAVGGPIAPGSNLSATDRAVYLLRYANYLPPLPEDSSIEPPGDNAVYRRDRLEGHEALRARGFWEAEIHRSLRARGERLALSSGASVAFRGGARLAPMLRQRFAHARHYGASRGGRMGPAERLARSAAAAAVPAVLLGRIAAALVARGQRLAPWASALPPLSLLLAAWAAGEARGLRAPGPGGMA